MVLLHLGDCPVSLNSRRPWIGILTTQGPNLAYNRKKEPLQMAGMKTNAAEAQQQGTGNTHRKQP